MSKSIGAPRSIILTPRTYTRVLNQVHAEGAYVAPRGLPTFEMLNTSLLLRNPLDRVVPDEARCLNLAFCFAEFASLLFGIDDIGLFTRYIKDFGQFSADGAHLDGAYGRRMHPPKGTWYSAPESDDDLGLAEQEYNHVGGWDGVDEVVRKLTEDPLTRRAVLAIYDREDLVGGGGNSTPCVLTAQFLARGGELHAVTNWRANDLVKGVCNDIVTFTLLQELIARRLGLRLGSYVVNAASLHLYESDLPLVARMEATPARWPFLMAPMPRLEAGDLTMFRHLAIDCIDDDAKFFDHEGPWSSPEARAYVVDMAAAMKAFLARHGDPEACVRAYELIGDRTIKHVTRHWLKRARIVSRRHLLGVKGDDYDDEAL